MNSKSLNLQMKKKGESKDSPFIILYLFKINIIKQILLLILLRICLIQ